MKFTGSPHASLRAASVACIAVLLASLAISADASTQQDRPVPEWIEIIQQQSDRWYEQETEVFAALRLTAGWSMPDLSGRVHQLREKENELPVLKQWLEQDGYALMNQLLKGEPITAEYKPYRPIVLGLYLRAGLDYHKTETPTHRAFVLDLAKVNGGREACLKYRQQVNAAGQAALRKGYLTGKLNEAEVDAIRLYRIAQGQRGVGEAFLPAHLGLHPFDNGKERKNADDAVGRHGLNNIISLVHGKPYFDFNLRRFEDVLQSEKYSDKLDTPYHLTLSLRPEGVLDFLQLLEGYEPFENEAGATVVRLKTELLNNVAGDTVRLKDRVGKQPIVLYINDPIDGPMTEQFPAFETFYQAYRDQVDCWFIAVDIHDWYYSGMQDMLSRDKPDKYPNTHYHSHEERARKIKNRYLESPHATFPSLICDNWQSVKNNYGTGGGANHWIVIDRDGIIAEYTGNQLDNLNHIETAVRRILANGGRMATESQAHLRWGSPDSAPNVVMPAGKRMRLHDAEVTAVDAANRALTIRKAGIGPSGTVQVRLKPFARVARDEAVTTLDTVKVGDRVAIDFYLDDYLDVSAADETELKAPAWGAWRRAYELGDQQLEMSLLGHYGLMRRRWYLDRAAQAKPIPARSVRVLDAPQVENPYLEPSVMWLSGRVITIDPQMHEITVKRAPITAEAAKGYGFYQQALKSGQSLALTDTARSRLTEVENWLKDNTKAEVVVLADEAVDYCLNGEFGGSFECLAVGDFVGVRYYPDRQRGDILVPHTIRITKPASGS